MTANNEVRKYLDIDMDGIRNINEEVVRLYRKVIVGYYSKDKEAELKKDYIGELNERVTRTQYRLLATEKAIIDKITNSLMLDKIKLPKNALTKNYSNMQEYISNRTKEIDEIVKNLRGGNLSLLEEYVNRYNVISNSLEKALFLSPKKLKSNINRVEYVQIKCSHSKNRISDKGRLIGSYFWKKDRDEKAKENRKFAEDYPHDNLRPKVKNQFGGSPILGQTEKQREIDERNQRNQTNQHGTIATNNKWHNYRRITPVIPNSATPSSKIHAQETDGEEPEI